MAGERLGPTADSAAAVPSLRPRRASAALSGQRSAPRSVRDSHRRAHGGPPAVRGSKSMRSSAVRQLAVATLALGFAVARPGIAAPTDAPAVLGAVSGHGVRSVEVVVLDRDGRAVPGLEAADFRLSIDGQPVPIVSFAGPER